MCDVYKEAGGALIDLALIYMVNWAAAAAEMEVRRSLFEFSFNLFPAWIALFREVGICLRHPMVLLFLFFGAILMPKNI